MPFFNSNEAFGLPSGSVRAGLALILVGAFIAALFVGEVNEAGLIALSAMASSAVTFYFTKRAEEGPSNEAE